jgi:hypothetical protein
MQKQQSNRRRAIPPAVCVGDALGGVLESGMERKGEVLLLRAEGEGRVVVREVDNVLGVTDIVLIVAVALPSVEVSPTPTPPASVPVPVPLTVLNVIVTVVVKLPIAVAVAVAVAVSVTTVVTPLGLHAGSCG